VKKLRFLGVVIGLERIKIEKKKVKGVLDWPTPELKIYRSFWDWQTTINGLLKTLQ